jgi:hypothetical protein
MQEGNTTRVSHRGVGARASVQPRATGTQVGVRVVPSSPQLRGRAAGRNVPPPVPSGENRDGPLLVPLPALLPEPDARVLSNVPSNSAWDGMDSRHANQPRPRVHDTATAPHHERTHEIHYHHHQQHQQ